MEAGRDNRGRQTCLDNLLRALSDHRREYMAESARTRDVLQDKRNKLNVFATKYTGEAV